MPDCRHAFYIHAFNTRAFNTRAICIQLSVGLMALGLMATGQLSAASSNHGSALIERASPQAEGDSLPRFWKLRQLDPSIPPTHYRLREWDGLLAIEANADASMALLGRPLDIDISQTPMLCWRWRVAAPLIKADMATRSGDDYAARVYVAFRLPAEKLTLVTRIKLGLARARYGSQVPDAALNYVWDNRYPVGTRRPNAYTSQTQMVVLRSGAGSAGQWVSERRDVLSDVRQAFGTEKVQAVTLAVAADTDNTRERAQSGFAELHFVARHMPCQFSSLPGKAELP